GGCCLACAGSLWLVAQFPAPLKSAAFTRLGQHRTLRRPRRAMVVGTALSTARSYAVRGWSMALGGRRRRWVRYVGLAVGVVAVGAVAGGWVVYAKLDGNIRADDAAARELARYEKERPTSLVKGAQNILLIGSDTRSGDGNARYGRDSGTERSDTTILLHLSAGRRAATAISLPRDLMVDIPACLRPDGNRSEPMFAMFNSAFETGGSACTI